MRLLLAACFASTVLAQGNFPYTAYSVDALHGSFGHWAFFGALSTGNSDECRAQMLIPAAFLPAAGGAIVAIEVSPHVEGTITYDRLDLQFGPCPTPTLSTNMDANLPAPVTCYSATPGTVINWATRTQWQRITLQTPYFHIPGTDLVFEARKVIQRPATAAITVSHQMSNGPQRRDLPRPVWAEGGPGSGRANQATGSMYSGPHQLIRLVFAGTPTLTITGPRVSGTQFRIGQSLSITAQGNPGELYAHTIDSSLSATPLTFPPVSGLFFLTTSFAVLGIGTLDGAGLGAQTLPIPNNPALVNLQFYFQSLTGGAALTWTNAVDAILQPQ